MAVVVPIGGSGALVIDLVAHTETHRRTAQLVSGWFEPPGPDDDLTAIAEAIGNDGIRLDSPRAIRLGVPSTPPDPGGIVGVTFGATTVIGWIQLDVTDLRSDRVRFAMPNLIERCLVELRQRADDDAVRIRLDPDTGTAWGYLAPPLKPVEPALPADATAETFALEVLKHNLGATERVQSAAGRAWTISSAIAGVLLAAGFLTSLETRPLPVKLVGVAAVAVWLITAGAFLRANVPASRTAIGKLAPDNEPSAALMANVYVPGASPEARFKFVRSMTGIISSRQDNDLRFSVANRWAVAAVACTGVALIASTLVAGTGQDRVGVLHLTPAGVAAVAEVCDAGLREPGSTDLTATVLGARAAYNPNDPTDLTIAAGICRAASVEVTLPPKSVASVLWDP